MLTSLSRFGTKSVVALLNRLLERESWARHRLSSYSQKQARLEALPFVLNLTVNEQGYFAVTDDAKAACADVTLSIQAALLPSALFDSGAVLRKVRLDGDAEFAQALSQVMQRLRPEPEEELSRFIGDVAAVRVVNFFRAAFAQARSGGERFAQSAADYLVAENSVLVGRQDVDAFAAEVARLRDAVERLDKRLGLLARARAEAKQQAAMAPASIRHEAH